MTQELKTEHQRVSPFKKAIIGLSIAATISGASFSGEYYLDPDIDIYTEKLTGYEYSQLKTELKTKMENRQNLSYKDVAMWSNIVDNEIKKCGKIELNNINSNNLIDQLNGIIENGC